MIYFLREITLYYTFKGASISVHDNIGNVSTIFNHILTSVPSHNVNVSAILISGFWF